MPNRLASSLGFGKKVMFAGLAAGAMVGPFGFGAFDAQAQVDLRNAPRFDVVSVKLQPGQTGGAWDKSPVNGRWTSKSMAIPALFVYAYGVSYNRVEGV